MKRQSKIRNSQLEVEVTMNRFTVRKVCFVYGILLLACSGLSLPVSAQGSLGGTVTKNGSPMSSPYTPFVDVLDSQSRFFTQSTNASGQYLMNGIAVGAATADAYASFSRYIGRAYVTIANGQTTTANFDWSVGNVSGRVTRGGSGLANARIEVSDSNNNLHRATTNSNGNYSLQDVTAGTANIYCYDSDGQLLGYRTITVTRNQTTTADFSFTQTGRVNGNVQKNGANLRNARIDVQDSSGNWYSMLTNTNGNYNILSIASGNATVYCYTPDGILVESRNVNVPAGGVTTQNFAFTAGTIQGIVRRAGVLLQGAGLTTGRGEETTTNATGNYSFEVISGTTELVCYSPDGYLIGTATPTVPAGGTVVVNFDWNVGTVRGTVMQGAAPLQDAIIQIDDSTGQSISVLSGANGSYLAENIAAGSVTATARTGSGQYIGQQGGNLPVGGELVLNFNYAGILGIPDPFVPTGTNSMIIRVIDFPGQTGLTVDLLGQASTWRWTGSTGNTRLVLTETPSGSGNYEASWSASGNSPSGQLIWRDDAYNVEVFDSFGARVTRLAGQVNVRGVSNITPVPATLDLGANSVTLNVDCHEALSNLEVRITRSTTTFRTLPLTGSGSQRSVVWDGRNTAGQFVPSGTYTARVWNTVSNRVYFPTVTINVLPGVSNVQVSPDPFLPTGCNNATITVSAIPSQTGLRARVNHPVSGDFLINLVETPAGSGNYVANWNGMTTQNIIVPESDSITVFVRNQDNVDAPTTRVFRLRGISAIQVSPQPFFEPTRGETAQIVALSTPVQPATGLNLEAQVQTTANALVKAIPMTETSPGVYSCIWDGTNTGGTVQNSGTYNVLIYNLDCATKRRYTPTSTVTLRQPRIIYVNRNAPGPTFNGETWATAYRTVQEAISNAGSSGEVDIWVAQGIYQERFTVRSGIALFGGFAGTETQRSQRNFRTRETVLDGNAGGAVITMTTSITASTVVNGFTIRNGVATNGGGITVGSGAPTIANNRFLNNRANTNGGGVYIGGGAPVLQTNTFIGNSAGASGGGLSMNVPAAGMTAASNLFHRNYAQNTGGGLSISGGTGLIVNNTSVENYALQGGGLSCEGTTATVVNNLIAYNSSGLNRTTGNVVLRSNNVFGNEDYNYAGIADPTGSDGNLSANPLLANVPGGNLHIQPNSPCRNVGDDSVVDPLWLDIDGQSRIEGGRVDIGADESDGTSWPGPTPKIIRVRPTGNDANNGSSWALAKRTVTGAINAAVAGDEIWVAQGVYAERITVKFGIALYGGFAGTETQRSQRDPALNLCTLDGNRGGTVVSVPAGALQTTVLDGFVVYNGQAVNGGGLFCYAASPLIVSNTFSNNIATTSGGGAYFSFASPVIMQNLFMANQALGSNTNGGGLFINNSTSSVIENRFNINSASNGGGLHIAGAAAVSMVNNIFSESSATNGGGLYLASGANVTLMGGSFMLNSAATNGGGLYSTTASPSVSGASFVANSAGTSGGGAYLTGNTPNLQNCTFTSNSAGAGGGGLFANNLAAGAVIANNTVQGNFAQNAGGGLTVSTGSPLIANNTLVENYALQGGGISCENTTGTLVNNLIAYNSSGINRTTGNVVLRNNNTFGNNIYNYAGIADPTGSNGNLSANPLLANVLAGNLHIQPGSPCRNAGDNAVVVAGWLDMDGQARIQSGQVDIGADESDGTSWPGPDPKIIRVRPTGNDNNDGTAWNRAKRTVTGAINAASAGDEIWVAQGVYGERITLKDSVALYGGFAANETQRSQRDWNTRLTILDGNRGGTVVTVPAGALQTTVLDGFIVRNGAAVNGGGLSAYGASPTIAHTTFANNIASGNGGGAYFNYSTPVLDDCTFTVNDAASGGGLYVTNGTVTMTQSGFNINRATNGGGIHLAASGNARVSSTLFTENVAGTSGGGIYLVSTAGLTMENSTFSANSAGTGGGIYSSSASPAISRTEFTGNAASTNGAGVYLTGGSPNLQTNTFRNNSAGTSGGGIYATTVTVNGVIANNVFHRNFAQNAGGGITVSTGLPLVANNTLVENYALQGGGISCENTTGTLVNNLIAYNSSGLNRTTGNVTLRSNNVFGNEDYNYAGIADPTGSDGNLSANPLLANVPGGNLHIQPNSPCRNVGDDSVVDPLWLDIDGQSRIEGGRVDIGADESDGTSWPGPTPKIIRVRPTGNDANNGSSWALAKRTVTGALNATNPGDEIWVAQGVYVERITLKHGIALYGGFAANETQRSQRDWNTRLTILDGNRGGTVVSVPAGALQTTVLDGFIVRNGSAVNGGGLACYGASPFITHNTFANNLATTNGGGAFFSFASPVLEQNLFTSNQSTGTSGNGGGLYGANTVLSSRQDVFYINSAANGGGIAAASSSVFAINRAWAQGNSATNGGGAYGSASILNITSSQIIGNSATSGGGLYITGGTTSSVASNNFIGNTGTNGGGIYLTGVPAATSIVNNTMADNIATTNGGGLYMTGSSAMIGNNLIAFNSSGLFRTGGTPTLRHNNLFGNTAYQYSGIGAGTNDISADPLFVNRAGGDYHLSAGSPCINAGDNALVQAGWTDIDGESRIQNDTVDIGADERSAGSGVEGDVNGDGCVDDADLLAVLFAFGNTGGPEDLNGDGIVDDADLLLVLFNFGIGC
jgi:predicted outer membrane repeat protein